MKVSVSWTLVLRALAAAAMLSTTACSSIWGGDAVSKDAKSLPEAERAVLLSRSQWYLAWGWEISIHAVDNDLFSGRSLRKAEVVPGLHTVAVDWWNFIGGMSGSGLCSFTLDLQPGHHYKFRSIENHDPAFAAGPRNNNTIDIEDVSPGEKQGVVIRLPCEVYPPANRPAESD